MMDCRVKPGNDGGESVQPSLLPAPVVPVLTPLRALLRLLLALPGQHVVLDTRAALPAGRRLALREAVETAPAGAAEARAQAPRAVLSAGHRDVGCHDGREDAKSDQDTHCKPPDVPRSDR